MTFVKYLISNLFALLICGAICISSAFASPHNISVPHQLELKPFSFENSYQTARAHWLPDYQAEITGSTAVGGGGDGTQPTSCEDMGYKSSIPDKQTCKDKNPGFGLTCYYDCKCEPKYNIETCPNGQKLSSDTCGGKASGCEDCPEKATLERWGWSAKKPPVITARVAVEDKRYTCAKYYFICPWDDYTATSPLAGKYVSTGGWQELSCPKNQKSETISGLSLCKRCVRKTCQDYNASYLSAKDPSKSCTQVTASTVGGLTCYTCAGCDTNTYQYDTAKCKTKNGGFANWTTSGSSCNSLFSSCICTPNSNCPVGTWNLTSGSNCEHGADSCNNGCEMKYKCKSCISTPPAGYTAGYGSCRAWETLSTTDDGCGNPYHKCLSCSSGQYTPTQPVTDNGICYGDFQTWFNAGNLIR